MFSYTGQYSITVDIDVARKKTTSTQGGQKMFELLLGRVRKWIATLTATYTRGIWPGNPDGSFTEGDELTRSVTWHTDGSFSYSADAGFHGVR